MDATTTEGRIAIVETIVTQEYAEHISYLAYRWKDEGKYESFADYEKSMKMNLPHGVELIKGSKRPFGCILRIPNIPYDVQVFVKGNSVGWKSVNR